MNTKIKTIVEAAEIPSIPHVLQKILIMTNDPNSSSSDLEKLILKEPGLAAYLMKTVNSAYYAFAKKIDSVNHAVVMLGFSTVSGIASGLALIDTFNNLPGLNKNYVLSVWNHALACAGMINILAKGATKPEQDKLFLTAIVHNVGHLLLSQHYGADYDELLKTDILPHVEDEQARFETDHTEIGAYLLESWKFSPEVIALVGAHHNPEPDEALARELRYLNLCDILSRHNEALGLYLNKEEEEIDADLLEMLKEADWTWDRIQENKTDILESVSTSQKIIAG